jgi:glutamyl-tRNA reductase
MALMMVGLSHKTAPLDLREKLALDSERAREALKLLKNGPGLSDLVLLSTCNRVEAYVFSHDEAGDERKVRRFLEDMAPEKAAQLDKALVSLRGEEALWHLLQVAASLDSLVLGESQILGQVKEAYELAHQAGAVGPFFHGLFQRVLAAAKEVRSSTDLGRYPASVPSIAVNLAERIFGDLREKKALVVGAGEMAVLTAEYLHASGVGRITFCNRTQARAAELARRFGGQLARFEDLAGALAEADIAVYSTGAQTPLLTVELAKESFARRHGAPQLYLDIAVPRNVEAAVKKLEPAYLYSMDDLGQIAEEHREKRLAASREAELLLRRRFDEIREWISAAKVAPTIAGLSEKFEALRAAEWEKQKGKFAHLAPKDLEKIEYLSSAVMKKILHLPIHKLRGASREGRAAEMVDALERLFELKEDGEA